MITLEKFRKKLKAIEVMEEDFPNQNNEYRRNIIVETAVAIADEIILYGSDGTVEETEYLTSAVAQCFMQKSHQANMGRLMREDLLNRNKK